MSGHLDRLGEKPIFENSLGAFYLTLTRGLGFKFLQEGKTMGLAAYGQDTYVDEFSQFYECSAETGSYKLTREHISLMNTFIDRILSAATNDHDLFQRKANLAYAGQYHTEDAIIKLCRYLYKKTKVDTLCLAGGVALNSVANYKILEHTPFKKIFVQPAAGDAGTAIGSALYGNFIIGDQPWQPANSFFSPYLGKTYSNDDVEDALNRYKDVITVEEPVDLFGMVSKKIAEGNIIGFFHGQSEIGPRALGNRSILADPRNPDMKDTINLRIKHREPFRPFAPIILEEHQTQYFAMEHPSHYMLFVPPIHDAKHEVIPSVTHYDGTGRVQTISQKINPVLHGLLEAFYKETGVPVLLNTSFNDNEEPIVESPMDAVKCFLTIDLDYLVLEKYIIRKK
ncbi:carbamoyltransferase family protein [Paenibacillus herberti]|uniref:carbamoyltransferase family protein n=1 Tax=Paenibacillus herberti TaxID=1619309 RepID=UPI001FED1124|nr:carbamoyltransferase C-terminal domain-containing protein [Paenibacillus herberti]